MGSLRDFDLPALKERFRLRVLVETGTGEGHSLRYAYREMPVDQFHSIEVDPVMMARARDEFSEYPDVFLWHGQSVEIIPQVIDAVSDNGAVLFWLDAHFPGSCSGVDIGAESDAMTRLPLEAELTVIVDNRDPSLDLFIIDDAWIYRDGIAECGDFDRRREVANVGNDSFVRRLLGETHLLVQDPRANGYTIAVPKLAAMYVLEDCLGPATSAKLREF